MKGWVQEAIPAAIVNVHNDAIAALASGTMGRLHGIGTLMIAWLPMFVSVSVLISGTGMICYGRLSNGTETRVGGWGVYTDGGSGYNIATEILKAVWASYDGSGPKTALEQAVLDLTGLEKQDQLIPWTYGPDSSWARIAS